MFQRSVKEFNWIQNYPWVLSGKQVKSESKSYNFSLYSKEFKSNIYTIYSNKNTLIGCLFLTIRNGHLKIPYTCFSEENSREVASFIIDKSVEMKVKTIVIYHKKLEAVFNTQLSFLTKKVFKQKYFITKVLEKSLNSLQKIEIQAGDGDVVFT